MARIRFPGRPGHRFDQIRVAYFNDDIKNLHDPSLAFLPQFRQGLRSFREIVGSSDEDDDFDGFSTKEIQESERRLRENEEKEEKEKKKQEKVVFKEPVPRLSRTRIQHSKQQNVDRSRNKVKAVVKKSYHDMLKEGFSSLGNAHCVVSMKPLSRSMVSSNKSRKHKFDKKSHYSKEIAHQSKNVKKTEKDMAKFLLEKAKQANLLQQQAKARKLSSNKVFQRKEFVLPTQSSRSSRVIIPNKRFLEDNSVTSPVLKKKRSLDNDSTPEHTFVNKTPMKSDGTMASPVKTSGFLSEKLLGSLEQPLIVDGKRDRKPSVKILEKIVDKGDKGFQSFKTLTSPIAAPKVGKTLFPTSPGPPATFQKASESQKFGMFGIGSARKQGASIVQKAKLQLNRAALNKSKAALARSLKAEMKREAKLVEIEKQSHSEELKEGIATISDQEKPGVPKKGSSCVVCGSKGKSVRKGSIWRSDLFWCYGKYFVCQACLVFCAKSRTRAKKKLIYKCDGKDPGNCKLIDKGRKQCRHCRILRSIELGFPHSELLSNLVGKQPLKRKTEDEKKGKDSSQMRHQGLLVIGSNIEPAVPKHVIGSDTFTAFKIESTSDELSPLKDHSDQRRRRRSSKETIKSPGDKSKSTMPETEPEPSTSATIESMEETSPQTSSHGPRIKHVCRNAAVVLGKTPATFPEKSEFRLSALPKKDKVELWKQDEEVKAAASQESDDDRPMEEIIEKSGTCSNIIVRKAQPEPKEKQLKRLVGPGGLKMYKRKMRCKQCPGCLARDCGICRHCLDKPKFGGPGINKQACIDKPKFGGGNVWKKGCVKRKCASPLIQRSATAAFINPKSSLVTSVDSGTDSNADSVHSSPVKGTNTIRQIERPKEVVDETEFEMSQKASTSVPISSNESQCETLVLNFDSTKMPTIQVVNPSESVPKQDAPKSKQRMEVRRLEFDSSQDFRLEHLPSKRFGKMHSKIREKVEIKQKYTKHPGNDNQCFPVTLVDPASRQWGSALSQPKYHPIKVDYKGKFNVNMAWSYGIAVTMSSAMCVRTLCFLCGSSGKHEFIFCNVCCEPFHKFCLEEFELPVQGHDANWCCARCQFCSVCGRQNHLLQCDKCQNMYHPECLGPNYPTKPTKEKKIWICTKCVKCKSCGATTPGTTSDATWTYDFSLCYECGKLMDKGNFCPICHKCYSDDDWESKMIQCNMCESWVHSKCEGLTDEMYEILSCLPEDLSFYCQRCSPEGCPEWLRTLRQELRLGLENIMQTLILSKCAQYIIKRDIKIVSQKQICGAEHVPDTKQPDIDTSISADTKINTDNVLNTEERTVSSTTESKKTPCDKDSVKSHETLVKSSDECQAMTETAQRTDDKGIVLTENSTATDTNISNTPVEGEHEHDVDKAVSDKSIKLNNGNNENVGSDTRTKSEVVVNGGESLDTGEQVCDNVKKITTPISELTENDVVAETNQSKCCEDVVNTNVSDTDVINSGKLSDDKKCDAENTEEQKSTTEEMKRENVTATCNSDTTSKASNSADSIVKTVVIPEQEIKHKGEASNDSVLVKSETLNTKKSVTDIVPSKHHVQFNIAGNTIVKAVEAIEQTVEPGHPKDLMEIAKKMQTGFYSSIAIFCEDILRIIQEYLDNDEETRTTRKKAVQSARSVFVKQMEKIFPWYRVKECRYWFSNRNIPNGMLPDATLPPTVDHTYAQWLMRTELPKSPQPSPFKRTQTPVKKFVPLDEEDGEVRLFLEGDDTRRCLLCLQYGDQDSNDAGRLLYCGQDDWAHINCALWSAEVYEDVNGGLQNLMEAYSRGKMLKCDLCALAGATVGCNTRGCKSNYHFMCARDDQCKFQEDKKVFCKEHSLDVDGELLGRRKFGVSRRVYVDCLNVRAVKKSWARGLHVTDINVLIGSCCVESLGRLTDLSDKPRFLQPVDFVSTRIYWSTKDARKRCVYTCRIVEVRPEMSKSPIVAMKDTRIIHDETDPDFVPFSKLDLTSLDLGHLKPTTNKSESCIVDLTVEDSVNTSSTLSAIHEESGSHLEHSHNKGVVSVKEEGFLARSASFSGVGSDKIKSNSLSLSWGGVEKRQQHSQVNLRGLSPQTLKLLNIKDPSKHTLLVDNFGNNQNEDLPLLKIADRLNSAASKSVKSNGMSESLGRSLSPLNHPHLRGLQRNRSRSLDCSPSPLNQLPLVNQRIGLIPTEKLPSVPWTPPIRMQMRANSWPKEGHLITDIETKIEANLSTSIINKGMSVKPDKLCEIMDIDTLSEPIGSSSPKPPTCKTTDRPDIDDNPERMEISMDLSQGDNSEKQQDDAVHPATEGNEEVLELHFEGDDIPETTIVVMTDSGEDISEEEAIKIVQEALSGNSSLFDNVTDEVSAANVDLIGDLEEDLTCKSHTDDAVIEVKEDERSESPFIPQFISSDILPKQAVIHKVNKTIEDSRMDCKDMDSVNDVRDVCTVSDESDGDSDVLDITDSVYRNDAGGNKVYKTDKETCIASCDAVHLKGIEADKNLENHQEVKCENEKGSNHDDETRDDGLCENNALNKDEIDGDQSNPYLIEESPEKSIKSKYSESLTSNVMVDDASCQTISDDSSSMVAIEEISEEEEEEEEIKCVEVFEPSGEAKRDVDESKLTEIDTHKKQVLRGLGLGTSDEVEQIKKNSPTKNVTGLSSFTEVDNGTMKGQKSSPALLKQYPLRRKTSRFSSEDNFSPAAEDQVQTSNTSSNGNDKREGNCMEDKGQTSELPVLDPIAKKIKEESLAKSCPEEKGPFKCQTCRRMYRTETSYEVHVKNCNFNVSSSEEEEDSEGCKKQAEQTQDQRSLRSRTKCKGDLQKDEIGMSTIKQQKTDGSSKEYDEADNVEPVTRSSLRKSTIFQRVALEVEERRLKEEAQKLSSPKRKGRILLKSKTNEDETNGEIENLAKNVEYQSPETRRVTRRSCDLQQSVSLDKKGTSRRVNEPSNSEKLRNSRTLETNETIPSKQSVKNDESSPVPGRRANRRRQKHMSSDSDAEPISPKQMKLDKVNSPENKSARRTRSAGKVENSLNMNEPENDSKHDTEKLSGERRKGRSKLLNKVGTEAELDVEKGCSEIQNDDDVSKENDCEMEISDEDNPKESDPKDNVKDADLSLNTSVESHKDDSSSPILDYASGLIIDPKTGMIYSSPSKTKPVDQPDCKSDNITDKDKTNNDEGKHIDDNVDKNKNCLTDIGSNEKLMECSDSVNDQLTNEDKCIDDNDIEDIDNSKTCGNAISGRSIEIEKLFPEGEVDLSSNSSCVKPVETKNEAVKPSEPITNTDNDTKNATEPMVNLENNSDMNKHDLSKAVLQLLKKGHKVVIKNPSSDKSYVWEKTEKGYVGKPLDKDTHKAIDKQTSASSVTDKKRLDQDDSMKQEAKDLPCLKSETQESTHVQKASKPLTASEILATRKIQEFRHEADKLSKQYMPNKTDTANQNVQTHTDNQRTVSAANVCMTNPVAILPAGAEYVGGILLSPPTGTPSDTQRTLKTTAELANTALQKSLSLKTNLIGANVSKVYTQTPGNQSLVQFINTGNNLINYPLVYQNNVPPALSQFSVGVNALSQQNMGASLLSLPFGLNSSTSQLPTMAALLTQPTVPSRNLPTNTNNKSMDTGPLPNILRKQVEDTNSLSFIQQKKSPTSTSESLKQYLFKRNMIPIKAALKHEKDLNLMGIKRITTTRNPSIIVKKPAKLVKKSLLKSPLKDHSVYVKKNKKQKRLQKNVFIKQKSPIKRRKPSTIAAPHISAKVSHPIIHPQKENHQLPVAAVEEEIKDIPLSTMIELENRQGGLEKGAHSLGHLEYEITSDDGFSCKAETLDSAWKQVLEKVQDARVANRFKQLSYTGLSGIELFGLSHLNVVYLLEQLSGAGYCRRYKFKFHKHEQTEQEVELLNPSGCIRSEPFIGRNPCDMFSFLMSRYRMMPEKSDQTGNQEMAQKSSRRATSMDLPMAMRFRKLKAFSRECVGVYRSPIHGRGLFCKRSIDAGEMIIEYAGEVIRNSMTDYRERYYESKGIGCYMFRIDDKDVVDATVKGSAARFINHSCEPNCYSKVITVDNRKHIVIFALRQILRGEELTYDYKFPIEEIKIPCTCGSSRCRKYLN